MNLDQNTVRELIHYNAGTGDFVWKKRDVKWFSDEPHRRSWNTRYAGKVAGFVHTHTISGYQKINIRIFGELWSAHRLAWLWMTGSLPREDIDHIDRNGTNNRWDNLREVTAEENMRNCSIRRDNTSGYSGVVWCKRKKRWVAKGYSEGR